MVVQCGQVVRVSVHVDMLTEANSSWGEKVITLKTNKIPL
jgi:hypothetical protein